MKILMFIVSIFLTVSVLSAGDIEKSTDTGAVFELISCGAEGQDACVSSETEKPSFLKYIKDQFVKFGGKEPSQPGEKEKAKNNKDKKPEISSLAELKRSQNIKMVELKKIQKKELSDLMEDADSKNQSELRKASIKMREGHRKALQELRKKHKNERKEFKKTLSMKKDSKKGKEGERKKKAALK